MIMIDKRQNVNRSSVDLTNYLINNFLQVKSGTKDCLFTNSPKQYIICKDIEKKDSFEEFDVNGKFKIAFSKKELEFIQKSLPNALYLLSPYALLYKFFSIEPIENALWVLNQENFITFAVIRDEKIIFAKHLKKDENFILQNSILKVIKDFYKSECCYFLETVFIYDAANLKDELVKNLKEATLLEIKKFPIDIENKIKELCKEKEYTIKIKNKKKFFIPNIVKYSIVFIFILLLGIDGYFKYMNSKLKSKLFDIQKEKVFLEKNISNLKKQLSALKLIIPVVQNIKGSNSLIKSSIKDIFDQIPDSITLTKAESGSNYLILKGFSTSKSGFYKLKMALKSFYPIIDVKFKKVKNGYKFLLINRDFEVKDAK